MRQKHKIAGKRAKGAHRHRHRHRHNKPTHAHHAVEVWIIRQGRGQREEEKGGIIKAPKGDKRENGYKRIKVGLKSSRRGNSSYRVWELRSLSAEPRL